MYSVEEAKVFYQVLVDYNKENEEVASIPEDKSYLESSAISSYPKASKIAMRMGHNIRNKFPESLLLAIEDEEFGECYIISKDDAEIASIFIVAIDYSRETIH